MSEHYDFHYQPTGSGAISGQQVLEQTEDAINELGDYVNDNVGGAMDVAQQALETAQNAEQDAQTALDTANSFSSAIQSAQQDASTALSTAQTAQTTASNANNTALQAQQDASSAVTTANNASGQVSTLSGTVTALGQRVTTAEGNIGQNTSDITALTTRVGTAEGNITTLQNDVSVAQGNASSAMATAGQVKQQSYVFRYSSTALVASSTNSNALLDNTDNLKVGDKVIDSSGVLFSITAIDSVNSTFTIGSALIDLALDANVVHTSGDEAVTGLKTFGSQINVTAYPSFRLYSKVDSIDTTPDTTQQNEIRFTDKNNAIIAYFVFQHRTDANEPFRTCWRQNRLDGSNNYYSVNFNNLGEFYPENNNAIKLGTSVKRWAEVYAQNYYYGSNNVEFSTKFVTSDTDQSVSGQKVFNNINAISSSAEIGVSGGNNSFKVLDKNKKIVSRLEGGTYSSGMAYSYLLVNNGSNEFNGVSLYQATDNLAQLRPYSSTLRLQLGGATRYFSDCYTSKINGLTPSSLGMPVAPSSTSYVDISGYITVLDSSSANTYTPPSNGYITFNVTGNLVQIFHDYGLQGKWTVQAGNANRGFIPVLGGVEVKIYITASSVDKFWFIPCQGNV